ncbi:MAG TPA: hypothetical protein VL400_26120 [Polyangiaceae bacterium]|jgi:hypothetical protein|nr:hypothetical protein [Polyangiaceae bacterium]
MDPKTKSFKSPDTTALTPDFGTKLVDWVKRDMERAKKAREERKAKAQAEASGGSAPGRAPGRESKR